MSKITIISFVLAIGLMSGIADAALNKENLITPYPHWHYFDSSLVTYGIGYNPFYYYGAYDAMANDSLGPNRGINAEGRQMMFMDESNKTVFKYEMRGLGNKAWYVLQVDNNWAIEFSTNRVDWTTVITNTAPYGDNSRQDSYWGDKPLTNESPYFFNVSSLMPADYLYVRIGDASENNGFGARVWNALITTKGYPYFYAGGREPRGYGGNGDQQWLYRKDHTSDSDNNTGRFADGHQKFIYKFDLPDDNDECWLHTLIANEYLLEISTNNNFSTIDLVVSNNPGSRNIVFLQLPLVDVLEKTDDNLIYVRFGDSKPDDGWGSNPMDFWISPHPITATSTVINTCTETELLYLWYNNGPIFEGNGFRFADMNSKFTYRMNFAAAADLEIAIYNEFLVEGSSNDIDWVTLFNAGDTHQGLSVLSFDPYTGVASGDGAVAGTHKFCSEQNSLFFLRIGDCDRYDGWGGNLQSVTINVVPEGFNIWFFGILEFWIIVKCFKFKIL